MTKLKNSRKNGRGRPSSYNPKFARQAYELAKYGATDKEIASILGISDRTLTRWKKDFGELCLAICNGRNDNVFNVKRSIYRRAVGYRYTETTRQRIEVERADEQGEVEKVPAILIKSVSKHMAPDVNACMSILKNRRPKEWADNPHAVEAKKKELDLRKKEMDQKAW